MGIILEDILEGINHLKNQSQNNDGKINNTLENKIQELLESNKSHNENLLSFINRISNSIGIETGVDNNEYEILEITPIEEVFIGTNNLRYKHIYYIAQCNPKCNLVFDDNNISQVIEISDIRWFSYKDALEIIRPYNKEKKIMIRNALKIIKQHIIFKYL